MGSEPSATLRRRALPSRTAGGASHRTLAGVALARARFYGSSPECDAEDSAEARAPSERYASAWQLKADLDQPTRVHVSGLSERLIEVTPWRRRLRAARFVGLVTVTPVAILVAGFRLIWWYLERRR